MSRGDATETEREPGKTRNSTRCSRDLPDQKTPRQPATASPILTERASAPARTLPETCPSYRTQQAGPYGSQRAPFSLSFFGFGDRGWDGMFVSSLFLSRSLALSFRRVVNSNIRVTPTACKRLYAQQQTVGRPRRTRHTRAIAKKRGAACAGDRANAPQSSHRHATHASKPARYGPCALWSIMKLSPIPKQEHESPDEKGNRELMRSYGLTDSCHPGPTR